MDFKTMATPRAHSSTESDLHFLSMTEILGLADGGLVNVYIVTAISTACVLISFLIICIVYKCCKKSPNDRGTYQVTHSILSQKRSFTRGRNQVQYKPTENHQNGNNIKSTAIDLDLSYKTNASLLMNNDKPNGNLKSVKDRKPKKELISKRNLDTKSSTNNPLIGAGKEWYV